ncbi:helix-turn-helix transcriptional regulator [Jannaschia seohaensis]|uniref:LuxR family transcriptional regulator n=1 Tax=Jannaschia seohaensis TaxID=475081 RepID=A0A2Y9APF1_9RHOB|nr:autoinducer binding domain-containing protein [Jannaschia seohaensis]PWJ19353.1 LuxR family transcriptional regulator [Jannaschia seohaensis]SSA46015.1 LuxR family transcriptional regulator [Jannaschia seohaensis]
MTVTESQIRDYGFDEMANAGFYIAFRIEFLLPEFEYNDLPRPWVHKYTQQGLLMMDPVLRWVYCNVGSIRWSEIDISDTAGVLREAARYDLNFGAAISIRDEQDASIRSFGNFCRSDREFEPSEIKELERRLELLFSDLTAPDDVTEAETEVLAAIRDGELIKEIAFKLSISEGAVKQRLRSAKDKLGARTTPHAVSLAVGYGLL